MLNLDLLKDLIRCKAVTENVEAVNRAVDRMHEFLKGKGLYCTVETLNGRKILYAATVPGKTPDVLLNAHLDVVPAPDSMFEPEERDGMLFARGSSDCQGNSLVLAEVLCSLAGKASVGAVFSTDEETGGSTTAYMVERGYGAKKIILILDAAPYGIAHAQKGIISLTLRANGKGGHSSEPWAFNNPIDLLVDGYVKLRAAWPALPADYWGDSMAPCIISGGQAFNQIPDTAEMVLNIRFIRPGDEEKIIGGIREITGLEVIVNSISAPAFVDESHPLMQKLKAEMQKRFPGHKVEFYRMHGATDARHFAELGIPIAILGSEGGGMHSAGEWVSLASLEDCRVLLSDFIRSI